MSLLGEIWVDIHTVERDQTRQKAKKLLLSQKQVTGENKLLKEQTDKIQVKWKEASEKCAVLENQLTQVKSARDQALATVADEKVCHDWR